MDATTRAFAVELCRVDGSRIGIVPIDADWEPAREYARLEAMRAGHVVDLAYRSAINIDPEWCERGEPFLAGLRLRVPELDGFDIGLGLDYFGTFAEQAAVLLVEAGTLARGDRFRYHVLAYRRDADPVTAVARFTTRPGSAGVRCRDAIYSDYEPQLVFDGVDPNPDLPSLLVPDAVLAEVVAATLDQRDVETGGILIGRLYRDRNRSLVFAEVTAQLPARHTEPSETTLTFTTATWTEARAALALRGSDELMLGWWHSHPVRQWCRNCPVERQRNCSLAAGFLSAEDRLLHRTVFPRAFTAALVVSDVGFGAPSITGFGWQHGLLVRRSFARLATSSTRTPLNREALHA